MHILVLTLIVFWFSWPIGLALVGLLILLSRGKSRRWRHYGARRVHRARGGFASTGNTAFDEYRDEALHRLQEERAKFSEFLERLRKAKDKDEFDQFMADRRSRPTTNDPQGASA